MASYFGSQTNFLVTVVLVVLSLFNFLALRKEFSVSRKTIVFGILPILVTMGVYMLFLGGALVSPMWLHFLAAGLVLGLILGSLTRLYVRDHRVLARRSRLYMLLWALIALLTQGMSPMLGTAMVGLGVTFMCFTLGMALSQHLVIGAKAGRVQQAAALAILLLLMIGASMTTNTTAHADLGPAGVYYRMAKDNFSIGNSAQAINYAWEVIHSTNSPGTQAKGYMVLYLSGAGGQYATMAHDHILRSGQVRGAQNPDGYAVAIGLGIMQDIQTWTYTGTTFPDDNVVSFPGATDVFSHELKGLWEDAKMDLGVAQSNNPLIQGIMGLGDDIVDALAASGPLDPDNVAQAGMIASAGMLITGLINMIGAIGQGVPTVDAPAGGTLDQPEPAAPAATGSGPGDVLSDGHTYHDGQTYTFDDGVEYQYTDGDFQPVRQLGDGETYTRVDGDERIWVGNQSWRVADWQQQQAINQQWDRDYRQRNQDLEQQYQEARQAEEFERAFEQLNNQIAFDEMHKLRRNLIQNRVGDGIDFDMLDRVNDIIDRQLASGQADVDAVQSVLRDHRRNLDLRQDRLHHDLRQAEDWADRMDRYTRRVEMTKYIADKSFDIASTAFGPGGAKLRAGYHMATGVAGGVGQGVASGNMVRSIAEGTASGAAAAGKQLLTGHVKTQYGSNMADWAGRSYDTVTSTVSGAYQGYQQGTGVMSGGLRGLGEGITNAAVDYGVGTLMDKTLPSFEPTAGSSLSLAEGHQPLSQLVREGGSNMSRRDMVNTVYTGVRDRVVKDGMVSSTQNFVQGKDFQPGIFS